MTSSFRAKGKDDDTEDEMPAKSSSSSSSTHIQKSASVSHRSISHDMLSPSSSTRKQIVTIHSESNMSKQGQHSHSHALHAPHGHGMHSGLNGLWMLVDGIGLAIITTATILEGYELWWEIFESHWETNTFSEVLWFAGRAFQVMGLFFLIGHAASFQIFPEVEQFGMLLLTVGPIVNMSACYTFHHKTDTDFLFNRRWMSSETLELIGISILDISLIDMEEYLVLFAEVSGFFMLCCAAILNFEYFAGSWIPNVGVRLDMVHSSECFGLIMLTMVAFAQYRIKCAKHEAMLNSGHLPPKQSFIV